MSGQTTQTEYPDGWLVDSDEFTVKFVGMGIVLHRHSIGYFTINSEGACRKCGTKVPPGIRVTAMMRKL